MPIPSTATILLSVAGIWTLAVVTPGPNFFLTAQTAVSRSRSAALWGVLGIACGTVIWGLCGFLGIAILFRTVPWVYGILKLAGGGYLIYRGLKLLKQSWGDQKHIPWLKIAPPSAMQAWRSGLLTNLSNPKSAAFVTSLFAASMPAGAPLCLGLTSVALMAALSLIWYSAVACLLSLEPMMIVYRNGRRWIDRTAGALFIVFGARLATDR